MEFAHIVTPEPDIPGAATEILQAVLAEVRMATSCGTNQIRSTVSTLATATIIAAFSSIALGNAFAVVKVFRIQ